MRTGLQNLTRRRRTQQALTLVEVMVAFLISVLAVAGLVRGYFLANTSSAKFALSLAASAQASQMMEQMRSATWDVSSFPVVDELTSTNFSNQVVVLESSGSGTNLYGIVYATNFPQITTISTTPPLRRIHVDTVWCFQGSQVITNSIETERAPNQ